jgi:hypothetical protein
MLIQILQNTPSYVFAIFVALLFMGGQQLFTRTVTLRRVSIMAAVMTGLSLYGTYSAFSHQPLVMVAWIAAAAASFFVVLSRPVPAGTTYDSWQQRFHMPGSVVPLALMMGIFFTKYVVGVSLVMHPELAHNLNAALIVGAAYGAFSGMFVARSARLWRLSKNDNNVGAGPSLAA